MSKKTILIIIIIISFKGIIISQIKVPKVYINIKNDKKKGLYFQIDGRKIYENTEKSTYKINDFINAWKGDSKGLAFNSENKKLNGKMYIGLIHFSDSKYPYPVYRSKSANIVNGKSHIPINEFFGGHYDMVGWAKTGRAAIGYRILDYRGNIIFNGTIGFKVAKKGFLVDTTIINGPLINLLKPKSVTISYHTNFNIFSEIIINGKIYKSKNKKTKHELNIDDLQPDTQYKYTIKYGNNTQTYSFKTAPKQGSRKPFIFAYASDSRNGKGGGERNMFGHNGYIVKKILAFTNQKNTAFMQFTGDLVAGYSTDRNDMNLQYFSFKNTLSPFARYFPVINAMGNHEAVVVEFVDTIKNKKYSVDKFPFETQSAEKIFADNFINPTNGPVSEDGAYYDKTPNKINFPSYKENVFHYSYDNVGVVVLNSNYLYATRTKNMPFTSGNIHGYIMDNQMKWLAKTLNMFEKNKNIDHVFVTVHTPPFPNGGHVGDDMYYGGDNSYRAHIAGKPVKKGIIERRDQLLDIIINKNKKVVAILTGDEHNYCKLKITPEMNKYPKNYKPQKLKLNRTIYQINNGAAGAPYYAQEKTPWTENASGFTTQNAVILFYIENLSIKVKVYNPDTLELIEEYVLK